MKCKWVIARRPNCRESVLLKQSSHPMQCSQYCRSHMCKCWAHTYDTRHVQCVPPIDSAFQVLCCKQVSGYQSKVIACANHIHVFVVRSYRAVAPHMCGWTRDIVCFNSKHIGRECVSCFLHICIICAVEPDLDQSQGSTVPFYTLISFD